MINAFKKTKAILVLASALTLSPMPARADIVFDPTNFIENLITAISSLVTEANTASALYQQTKGTIELAKSTQGLGDLQGLSGANEELQMYNELRLNNQQLESTLRNSLRVTQDMQAKVGSSNMSWDEYKNSKNASDMQSARIYQSQYKSIDQSMTDTANKRRAILNRLQGAQGQTSATQAVGTQIDILIGQNQQMISELGAKKMQEGLRIEKEQQDQKLANDINNAYQQSLTDSSKRFVIDNK